MVWTLDKAINYFKDDKLISREDKALVLKFIDERRAVVNLSDRSSLKIISLLKNLTKLKKKPWDEFRGRDDVISFVGSINSSELAPNTKQNYKTMFKQFYRWLVKNPHPIEIEDIKVTVHNANRKLPENMLTEEDIVKMVDACEWLRDKAILMTLWSTGARASELLGMKIGSIEFDDNGAKIRLSGKTGDRVCRVIEPVPYLRDWIKHHPKKGDINTALWTDISYGSRDEPLSYYGLQQMIKKIARKCGIQKPSHPHAWRASRATYLAKFLTTSQLKAFFGWKQTAMCDVYISMHSKDVDEAIQRIHGKQEQKAETSSLTPVKCPRCKKLNGAELDYCGVCNYPLRPGVAISMDEKTRLWLFIIREIIDQNPRLRADFERELKRILEKQG
jgi:site-specific recombinase XerD